MTNPGEAADGRTPALTVIIGSPSAERAASTAAALGQGVRGADNITTARESDVVIIATPWEGHGELLTTPPRRTRGQDRD